MAKKKAANPAPVADMQPAASSDDKASARETPAFIFVGDENGHGPDEIALYGYTFKKNGKPVAVESKAAAAKFAGNSHFKAA